ncbi:TPA: hypothetical protein IVM20_002683 [Enterococcus faecium]|uniref:hypothetical protein n=1 Tax=Enterococcus TaxID=1350 RepID=UPI000C9F727A|nr:hypothetical protein [Enterococcus faecium]MCH3237773.1 hypothetical protein [Enterococcus faecium]MCH3265482.1 hypothetical protein [Enterococcus faecium]MCH3311048.1 hypothetical protein [Enterococcus faecium]MCH3418228.1 hypothetical protein [Enterococcus faecium]MCH3423926.1 hypothetical protein [Enterococcus faecium]
MKKLFANEKIDLLYSIILVLIWIIFLLISKLLHFHSEWVISFIGVFVMGCINLPTILRRKKQYKKIDELRKVLNLSIKEVREIADIGRYDLSDWNWDKAHISPKKLYLLEDTLEKMYVKQFGKEFEMRK